MSTPETVVTLIALEHLMKNKIPSTNSPVCLNIGKSEPTFDFIKGHIMKAWWTPGDAERHVSLKHVRSTIAAMEKFFADVQDWAEELQVHLDVLKKLELQEDV